MFRATIANVTARKKLGDHLIELDVSGPGSGLKWLLIEKPPPYFEECIGVEIMVKRNDVYIGDTLWAKRVGDRRIQLVPKPRGDR